MRRVWAFVIFAVFFISGCAVEQATAPARPERAVETVTEMQQEEAPDVQKEVPPVPAASETKPSPEMRQETVEKGGTLQEWKQFLLKATGPDSEESRTAAECEALMVKKAAECSQHQGWSVDNAMEITDFNTDQHYEFHDVRRQDCPGASPTDKPPSTTHVDTAFLDAQTDNTRTSSYQVVCSIGCNWWDCGTDLTGTWEGGYRETSSDAYCKYQEEGTKTFKITMKDAAFSGTAEYQGVSTIRGGEHCEGGTYSNKGTLSGTISGNKVSGTIRYSETNVPFTATVEGDALAGTYSYTTAAYGSPLSGNGEFTLRKK
jgi:hypothetical protein